MHKQRLFILIAAGVGLIGAVMPWQTASAGIFGSASVSAFGSGWVGYATIAGILGAAGILFKDSDKSAVLAVDTKKIVLGAGGAVAVFSLLAILIISTNSTSVFGVGVSLGMGPFITLLAGVAILGIPFSIKEDGNFKMPTKDSIKQDMK